MQGRPKLFTSYEADASIFPTNLQRGLVALFIAILIMMPFDIPGISGPVPRAFPESWPIIGNRFTILGQIPILKDGIPFVRFLGDAAWLRPMTEVFIFAVAALGLNILAGMAGQVSLGHAFFMGVGACTAVVLGGAPSSDPLRWGLELPIWIWLPAAGVGAARQLRLVAAVFSIRRTLRAPWMTAPLVQEVSHSWLGVPGTELHRLAAIFAVQRPPYTAMFQTA